MSLKCVFFVFFVLSLSSFPETVSGSIFPPKNNISSTVVYLPPKCGRKAAKGDKLTTNYVGYFINGEKFDSTWDRGEPMTYVMGEGTVIKGAEMGAMGMCVGERRHTIMPPELAYEYKDYGQIPAGSILVFDEVLSNLEDGPKIEDTMAMMGLVQNPDGSFPLFK